MQKLITASILLIVLVVINTNAFAGTMECKFKGTSVTGIKSIRVDNESLFINKDMEIPLEKSRVKCGNFGRQTRLEGMALGFQVVLETCSSEDKMKGQLIDAVNQVAAEVTCNEI